MDNGLEGKLASKMSGLALKDSASSSTSNVSRSANSDANTSDINDTLVQVMKALEAADATIRQQGEENTRLRGELQRKTQELEIYKINESMVKRSHPVDQRSGRTRGPYEIYPSIPSFVNLEDKIRNMDTVMKHNEDSSIKRGAESQLNSSKIHADPSQLSSPSALSVSPRRYPIEGGYDLQFNSAGHGSIQMDEVKNSNTLLKQDSALKIRDHEEEILQMKKHLSDYSMKEAELRNEKCVLEKRIAHMRLAFDQQQQDLVDAASKALSYRQDVIEENIRLTYDLQAVQQERTTFVSSLLPILAEYSLQPPVPDAQSIVSNVRVLFKHLQEKLIRTESKLKESQYQLAPCSLDVHHSNVASQSPSNPAGAALNKTGLELVPQLNYLGNTPLASPDARTAEWDVVSHHQRGLGGGVAKNTEADDRGRYSPLASRNPVKNVVPAQYTVTAVDTRTVHHGEETSNRQVAIREPVRNKEIDDPEAEGHKNERESSANRGTTTLGDPSTSYSPYIPSVLEEPTSSYSEAADDDPLPAIEGLQISGEAFPGRELQASGYSINGTTSCNFEWVRHLEDGSVDYIDGAKQPNYLVTADDVNTYLAIEIQPLDDRKRKGELVKVFANEQRKIVCDPGMQIHIERAQNNGHASYRISIPTGYLDIWEPATLAIKRKGYSIKCSGSSGVVVNEKFSLSTTVSIPYGHPTEFEITSSSNAHHVLRADNSADSSSARDTIVLTLRLFILQASKKKKKRGLFFHK